MASSKKQPGTDARKRIPDDVRDIMIQVIADHAGHEVLFVCDQDEAGRLCSVSDVAHGSRGMVPVLSKNLKQCQVLVHNHPSGRTEPSDADVRAAAMLADQGVGSWIVDNAVERLYVVAEVQTAPATVKLDLAEAGAVLGADGPLAARFPGYSPRPPQIEMLSAVCRAFNEDLLVSVEAGTGVGKSFAYLIPAMLWASRNNERVVVSTATINLQQQLIEKDIPAVASFLGLELKAVLAKGRGNYLCRKRLSEALDEEDTLLNADGPLEKIREWAENSPDGSKSDLPFIPEDGIWSRINADADACPGMRCPQRDECFFFRARREAATAKVIVANHHLLFADAAMRSRGFGFESTVVLPAFQRLIFDEAHTMDEAATTFFSDELNRFTVLKYLALLHRRKKNLAYGLLPVLETQGIIVLPQAEAMLVRIRDAMFKADTQGTLLLGEASNLRLVASEGDRCAPLMEAVAELQAALLALGETLRDAVDEVDDEEPVPAVGELDLVAKRILALAAVCESFRAWHRNPDKVYYLERIRTPAGDSAVQFIASPLDVGPLLSDAVFKPYRTVVMTSATLRVKQSFDFFLRRVGLWVEEPKVPKAASRFDEWADSQDAPRDDSDDLWAGDPDWAPGPAPRSREDAGATGDPAAGAPVLVVNIDRKLIRSAVSSPFDYASRVLLGISEDAPDPQSPAYQPWVQDFVLAALRASGGHGLVLFTSYDMLKRTFEYVRPLLEEEGILCFRQGSEERSRLLKRFNAEVSSCLFATDSFWEGVDSPGDTLQLVILCRLPFRVPTDPLVLARSERIEARGGSAFMEISVPEAVMKLRQGFGRLMRRESDHGVVLIPDKRIITKAYGRIFLDSLPPARRLVAPAETVVREAARFLDYHRARR